MVELGKQGMERSPILLYFVIRVIKINSMIWSDVYVYIKPFKQPTPSPIGTRNIANPQSNILIQCFHVSMNFFEVLLYFKTRQNKDSDTEVLKNFITGQFTLHYCSILVIKLTTQRN